MREYILRRDRTDSPAEAGCAASAAHPPRGDALGLSTTHIRPRKADLWQANVYAGGSLIEVHSPGIRGQRGGGKRGIVKRFSEASRRRLLRALSKVKRDQLPVFVTLTYPDDFPGDPIVWKGHLKAWFKRLKREHPDACGFWKLELKPRLSGENVGKVAPHFHLLLWGLPPEWKSETSADVQLSWMIFMACEVLDGRWRWKREVYKNGELESSWTTQSHNFATTDLITYDGQPVDEYESTRVNKRGESIRVREVWVQDARVSLSGDVRRLRAGDVGPREVTLKAWLSWTWYEVVGSGDPRHLRAGTRCEELRSRDGVMYYAAKYVCKLDTEAVGNAGRFWGIHNIKAVPWAEAVQVPLDRQQSIRLMRVARRYVWSGQRQREHPRKIHWRANCGMTFFGDAGWWLQRLPQIAGG